MASEANTTPSTTETKPQKRGMQFPWKLHQLLEESDKNGDSHVVSWLPDGKAFKVHEKAEFSSRIMPVYFNSTKHKTFQRSLNLWGFEKINTGPDKGACYHPFFLRGKPDLCHSMVRVKIKGHNEGSNNGTTTTSSKSTGTQSKDAISAALGGAGIGIQGLAGSGAASLLSGACSLPPLVTRLPALPSSLLSLPTQRPPSASQVNRRGSISDFIRSSGSHNRSNEPSSSLLTESQTTNSEILHQLKRRNDALEVALATTQSTINALTGVPSYNASSSLLSSSPLDSIRRQMLLSPGLDSLASIVQPQRNHVYEAALAAALASNVVNTDGLKFSGASESKET